MSLETIKGKTTNWCGLWWHPEYNGFSSESINLSQLKQFKGTVRLYVRKNKYFNRGHNGRPNYTFCLRDAQSETFKDLEVTDTDGAAMQKEQADIIQRLANVMREGRANANAIVLPSESQARAHGLMQEAVSLIEELTGETWDFSFLTWG